MLAFIVTQSKTINITLNGKNYNVSPEMNGYSLIVSRIKEWQEDLDSRGAIEEELYDLLEASNRPLARGNAELRDGKVFYCGQEVHSSLADRIIEIDRMGLPPEPMLRFLENVLQNPSEESREELYDFLQHKNIPITEDGCFLAYKAIRWDYKDKYSGTIDNTPGLTVAIPRSDVDDDRSRTCSHGLHVGAIDYVRSYGGGENDRFVIVKINPRDAVSVPRDHNAQKLRVCQYEVLIEVSRDTVLDLPVYSSDGSRYDSLEDFDADQAWEDDDYYEEEREEYLNNLWRDEEDDEEDEEWGQHARTSFLEMRREMYDQDYDRDNVCRLAFERGLTKTIEAGRTLGKTAVCSLLAADDLKREMAR